MKQIINVFILTTVLFITGTTSFAQEPDGQADAVQYDFSTFTINGFEVAGPEYTEQDIYTRGKPRFLIEKSVQVIITYKLHYPVILVP